MREEKLPYLVPVIEFIQFDEDVILTSGGDDDEAEWVGA